MADLKVYVASKHEQNDYTKEVGVVLATNMCRAVELAVEIWPEVCEVRQQNIGIPLVLDPNYRK